MSVYLLDRQALRDVSVQHGADEVDAAGAHDPWHPQLVVQNLVDAIEGVFFVDDSVEQNA